ncbi:hypothetical protein [Salinisphaera sp. G21_0]|uniref:hypothetical protein n=1 Tax=Salinisphaera sp. G21_0 TaxID=2821094 RepID=UPI001ADC8079|nr:hypothetical protein [Salinisphaera sp. G21_0]MBO9482834.1 hypothetical protein [Salinisphaera sp. G21_0]
MKRPATRGYASSDQFINSTERGSELLRKIENSLKCLADLLQSSNKRSVLTDIMHQLKHNYSTFNIGPVHSSDLPENWVILLSPQMFCLFGDNIQDWERIIEKSAWNYSVDRQIMRGELKNKLKLLFRLIHAQEPDVHYLNWLCDLYRSVPQFLKYILLAILQTLSGSCDSCQLKGRLKGMLESYSLRPDRVGLLEGADPQFSQHCINLIKTMTMSSSLLERLSQPRIHQQLHYQPVGNSVIIPEKLMSGEAAFLNVSKSTSYKPIIFDCTSLSRKAVNNKIAEKIKSGLKPVISEISESVEDSDSNEVIRKIFFSWLAAHQRNDATPPIWVTYQYNIYSETRQPYYELMLTPANQQDDPMTQLKLPPKRLKDHFNRPSAVVLQEDDLLVLLDEFLALIAD